MITSTVDSIDLGRIVNNFMPGILKNAKYVTNDKILNEKQNCQFQFSIEVNNLVLGKLCLRKKSTQNILRTYYFHKKRKLSAVTLEVAPERRTELWFPKISDR